MCAVNQTLTLAKNSELLWNRTHDFSIPKRVKTIYIV